MTTDYRNTTGAIETEYAGIRFRSRLEARWAIFFDNLGVAWEYENEAYTYDVEEHRKWNYLPDFYLPKSGTYVEVKGDTNVDNDYLHMLGHAGHFLPGVHNSCQTPRGVLLLGQIPRVGGAGSTGIGHIIIGHYKGLAIGVLQWCGSEPEVTEYYQLDEYGLGEYRPVLWQNITGAAPLDYRTSEAYRAARGHRFWK